MLVFSVIVPVYNSEHFLFRCVNSILCQSFSDFEILLVDDGSTDGSGAICDELAQKDRRVRAFHKENGGVSSARNVGLIEANGQYVLFVDSDDYLLTSDALSSIFDAIVSNEGCELVCFTGKTIFPEDEWSDVIEPTVYDYGYQCLEQQCILKKCIVFGSVFVQCYKKSVIDSHKICFDENVWYGEDRLFVCTYFLIARKTVAIPDVLYGYVVNENSLMHDEKRRKRLDSDNRKVVMQLEKQCGIKGEKMIHLHQYMHGIYVQSIGGLKREEINWKFLFRNAVKLKLFVKDILLFMGVNLY